MTFKAKAQGRSSLDFRVGKGDHDMRERSIRDDPG